MSNAKPLSVVRRDNSDAAEALAQSQPEVRPVHRLLDDPEVQSILLEIVEEAESKGAPISVRQLARAVSWLCKKRGLKRYPKDSNCYHRWFRDHPDIQERLGL